MRRPVWTGSARQPKAERRAFFSSRRDRLAVLLALLTVVGVGAAFVVARDTRFLMPGPLTSAHSGIEKCSACHTKNGDGKFTWLHGLVAGDPVADSHACLTCHKMPDTAFNAHGASLSMLEQSTQRLTKVAAKTPVPRSARAQNVAFPTDAMVSHGLLCATCHQEHQGANFSLDKISNEQCRSCHVVKFDSFDGRHPEFEGYPFKRRSRLIYDHAGHFGKHFPEVAKKDPAKRIPATCSSCHNSREDKRIMAVAPFDQTCTSCHLDQITGKERTSGPKGIAFLSLPGLDLKTLQKKKASIGEWPAESEAELTPFMKVMIGRNDRGRALIKTIEPLNLQDLSRASDTQIRAVTDLVWDIKRLFFALIMGKASDVLADLSIGGGANASASLVVDLTASIPRDVIVSAYQQWLPNLATEMANRSDSASAAKPPARMPQQPPPKSAIDASKDVAAEPAASTKRADTSTPPATTKPVTPEARPRSGATDQTDDLLHPTEEELRANTRPGTAVKGFTAYAEGDGSTQSASSIQQSRALHAGGEGAWKVAQAELRQPKAADQTDDLLTPTEEELRGVAAPSKGATKAAEPGRAVRPPDPAKPQPDSAPTADATPKAAAQAPVDAPAPTDAAAANPQARAAPVPAIQSDIDPENWAEYGGWYRQDYAIFYRPTGHKDRFVYSWLVLTGPLAPKGDKSPASSVFDYLTGKDAPGSCTKCHSVDDIEGKGRLVNFAPPGVKTKQGRFTNFIHEPHFGILDNRGCLTCHDLTKGQPYLKSYEHGNPKNFVSGFGAVKKDLCQSCHNASAARQDCLLCHKYHVNGVVTPIMSTKIPLE